MKITKIINEEAKKIIETREPIGLFYVKEESDKKTHYIGIDNSTGDAWVEEFKKLKKCKAWLRGEIEDV